MSQIRRIAGRMRRNSFQRTWVLTLMVTSLLPLLIAFLLVMRVTTQDSLARQHASFEEQISGIRGMLDIRVESISLANKTLANYLSQQLNQPVRPQMSQQLEDYIRIRDNLNSLEQIYRIDRIRVFSDRLPYLARGDNINFFPLSDLEPLRRAHPELLSHASVGRQEFILLDDQQIRSKSTSLFKATAARTLSFYGMIYNVDGEMVVTYLMDYIAEDFLASSQPAPEGSDIRLYDREGALISQMGVPLEEEDGEDGFFVNRQVVSPMDWTLEVRTRRDAVAIQNDLSRIYAVIILLTFVLAIVISLFMSRKTIQRLRNYRAAVESIPLDETPVGGDRSDQLFQLIMSRPNQDEIDQIMTSLYTLMRDNLRLIGESNRHALEIEKYKFKVLQEQINPHFLYNALETIRLCILLHRQQDALNTLNALSRFYRIALSKGRDTISLREELEMVENYLSIENIGYDGMLWWSIDAGEDCLALMIPKFLLQPLVENSILHSRVEHGDQLRLEISARMLDGRMEITVRDNGTGIDPDTLAQLRRNLASEDMPKGKNGFGMNNVNRRIKLFYGEAYGLRIESEPGRTENIIVLPIEIPEE